MPARIAHRHHRFPAALIPLLWCAMATAVCGGSVLAQEPPVVGGVDTTTASVTLRIRDQYGAALRAAVSLPELGLAALADESGVVSFTEVPLGDWGLQVTAFAFHELRRLLTVDAHLEMVLRMEPSAIEIEGIEVVVDRRTYAEALSRRRNLQGGARLVPEEVLLAAPHSTMLGFLEGRFGLFVLDLRRRCPLVRRRGENRIVLFYVDEELVTPRELQEVRPGEFALVESFGGQIRAYTADFLKQMERSAARPDRELPDTLDMELQSRCVR